MTLLNDGRSGSRRFRNAVTLRARSHVLVLLFPCLAASACGGTRGEVATAAGATAGYVPADAEFVRDMIVHHAQALAMTDLVPERTESADMGLLARRIEESQEYEIGLMRSWLEARGEPAPPDGLGPHGGHEAHGGGHAGMAGMASPEQMAALAGTGGGAFDRMFLELMTRHHEGALTMVDELLAHDGAGQEPELFVLISHIDADQRAEIARMRRMLNEMDRTGEQG